MSRGRWALVSPAVLASGALLLVWLLAGLEPPVWLRLPLAVSFLAIGPGHGWVRLLGLPKALVELAATLAVSLALSLGVATTMALLGVWSAVGGTAVLLLVGVAGAATAAAAGGRSGREEWRP